MPQNWVNAAFLRTTLQQCPSLLYEENISHLCDYKNVCVNVHVHIYVKLYLHVYVCKHIHMDSSNNIWSEPLTLKIFKRFLHCSMRSSSQNYLAECFEIKWPPGFCNNEYLKYTKSSWWLAKNPSDFFLVLDIHILYSIPIFLEIKIQSEIKL